MKILITAPSLDENRNVSGISTIVRQIIRYGTADYSHFAAGREDGEPTDAAWMAKQAALPFRFYGELKRGAYDLVHINTALTELSIWRDAALAAAAKFARVPVIVAVHGGKYLMNPIESSPLKAVTRKLLNAADTVVVYSENEREQLVSRWPDLRIRILPNAVPQPKPGLPERNNPIPLMIFFGRMHESKGLSETIEACKELVAAGLEFRFNAFGEGPLRQFFVDGMTEALGDRFMYGGVIAGDEKWNRLAESDIFVLASSYGEGLPMAMLEAMAVGCVVVASDIASVTTVVDDGTNGHIVEPGNAADLAKKLTQVLNDREGWQKMGQNAAATVRDKFGISGYIETLENIYAEAVDGR